MTNHQCTQCGKGAPRIIKGLCRACYNRARRARIPRLTDAELIALRADWEPRFSYTPDPATGCWEWDGVRSVRGCGILGGKDYSYLAHRLAYATATGDTDAPVVAHTCGNPGCVNPAHLRRKEVPVTGAPMPGVSKPTSGNYKRTYATPWGVFRSAPKAAEACPLPISARTLMNRYKAGTLQAWWDRQSDGEM